MCRWPQACSHTTSAPHRHLPLPLSGNRQCQSFCGDCEDVAGGCAQDLPVQQDHMPSLHAANTLRATQPTQAAAGGNLGTRPAPRDTCASGSTEMRWNHRALLGASGAGRSAAVVEAHADAAPTCAPQPGGRAAGGPARTACSRRWPERLVMVGARPPG